MPKVSVIMSVYNGQRYLREAIDSILNQTFSDFEFIIVNDGSTDRTTDILASYRDPRIKIINQPHLGMAEGRNKAIRVSEGKYIAIMDADDISLPQRLEIEVELLDREKHIGGVSTDIYLINEQGKITGIRHGIDSEVLLSDSPRSPNNDPTYMIRSEILKGIGGYRKELWVAADYDLYLRLAEITILRNINKPLYKWRISLVNDSTKKRMEQYRYGKLAEILAKERRKNGKDSLQLFGEERIKIMLDNISKENEERERVNGYYFWGKRFYNLDDYQNALRFLLRISVAELFNKDVLTLLFKVIIKLLLPKKIWLILKRFYNQIRLMVVF